MSFSIPSRRKSSPCSTDRNLIRRFRNILSRSWEESGLPFLPSWNRQRSECNGGNCQPRHSGAKASTCIANRIIRPSHGAQPYLKLMSVVEYRLRNLSCLPSRSSAKKEAPVGGSTQYATLLHHQPQHPAAADNKSYGKGDRR